MENQIKEILVSLLSVYIGLVIIIIFIITTVSFFTIKFWKSIGDFLFGNRNFIRFYNGEKTFKDIAKIFLEEKENYNQIGELTEKGKKNKEERIIKEKEELEKNRKKAIILTIIITSVLLFIIFTIKN